MNLSPTSEAVWRAQLYELIATNRAREIREGARLSRATIARTVGADVSTVYRWESGERRPSGDAGRRYYETLVKLAKMQAQGVA